MNKSETPEIWVDVKGYDNGYQVSNLGNVRRKGIYHRTCCKGMPYCKPIKKGLRPDGYENATFCNHGKEHTVLIHRIVAEHFIPNPLNLPEVNHIDYDRSNNRVDNLEWCTHESNVKHSAGRQRAYVGKIKNKNPDYYVYKVRGKYFVSISWCNFYKFGFETKEEAIRCRDEVIRNATKHHTN